MGSSPSEREAGTELHPNPAVIVPFLCLLLLQRYYDASLIYEMVLKQDSSCTEAAQELKRVQTMQLMVRDTRVHEKKAQ